VVQVVADALRYGERQLGLYQLRAWVPMVNHVHISIYPEACLSRVAKAIKNHSGHQANAIFAHHWAHRLAVLARRSWTRSLAILRTIRWWRGWQKDRPGGLSHLNELYWG
jgi:hypothetical protein